MGDAIFELLNTRLKKLEVFMGAYHSNLGEEARDVFERWIRAYLQDVKWHLSILEERVEEKIKNVRDS